MQIQNTSRKNAISNVQEVKSTLGKMKGLMFKEHGRILMRFSTPRPYSIWMPCMRMSIDVAFIDSNKRIVHIEHSVRPFSFSPRTWRTYRSPKPCAYILETEEGVIRSASWKKEDQLFF